MSLRDLLSGAVVMGPMTKGSNLPYRRLAIELGAQVLVSEMVVARRLKQRRRGEFALIRRAPGEPVFGVQLAGNKPEEMGWAAALVESRGADFIDLNLGCPIDHFTRMGLGAAIARQPKKVRRIVEAMKAAVKVPVTVKFRLGWKDNDRNHLDVARAAVDGGADGLFVHGRTREARYRHPAEWDAIADVAAAVTVPVVGNGDLLYAHEIRERLATSGCVGVMVARGALIKPWIFREAATGYWDITAEERLAIYRRYVELGSEHWGRPGGMRDREHAAGSVTESTDGERGSDIPRDATVDDATQGAEAAGATHAAGAEPEPHRAEEEPEAHRAEAEPEAHRAEAEPEAPVLDSFGRERLREFLRWHVGFWCRYVPQRADGSWPSMQTRESQFVPRSALEALFARSDDAALDYVTDELLNGGDLASPPPVSATARDVELVEAG